jgi:hypothetical protein
MAAVGAGTTLRLFRAKSTCAHVGVFRQTTFAQQFYPAVLPRARRARRAQLDMGKIGFAIILAAIAAYAADHRWNDGRYTRSTVAVLRAVQHAIHW